MTAAAVLDEPRRRRVMNLNRGGGTIMFMVHNIYYKNVTKRKFQRCVSPLPHILRQYYESDSIAKL